MLTASYQSLSLNTIAVKLVHWRNASLLPVGMYDKDFGTTTLSNDVQPKNALSSSTCKESGSSMLVKLVHS